MMSRYKQIIMMNIYQQFRKMVQFTLRRRSKWRKRHPKKKKWKRRRR